MNSVNIYVWFHKKFRFLNAHCRKSFDKNDVRIIFHVEVFRTPPATERALLKGNHVLCNLKKYWKYCFFFGNIIIKTINTYTQNKYKAWLAWYRTIILTVNRDSSKIKVTIAKLQISIITGIKWELIQKSLPTNKVKVKLQIQILFEIRCTCTYISHGGSVQFHCKWTRILMLYGTRKFFNSMQ